MLTAAQAWTSCPEATWDETERLAALERYAILDTGRVRGLRPGRTLLLVESEGRRAAAEVTVTAGVIGEHDARWAMEVTDLRGGAELAAVGLAAREGHYPTQLSGGEQQRVAIARATAPAPKLLLADEPTGNLDAATGAKIIDLLFDRVSAAGAGLLVITHDPAVAERAGRVIRIADGRIAG